MLLTMLEIYLFSDSNVLVQEKTPQLLQYVAGEAKKETVILFQACYMLGYLNLYNSSC